MERDEYHRWADAYAATFAMTSDSDVAMFGAWFEVFRSAGYTIAELQAARLSIARNPPTFRNEHLAAIHRAIRDARVQQSRRRMMEPAAGDRGVCAACGDTGAVIAPHPKFVAGGDWRSSDLGYRATAAVACSCLKGRNLLAAYDRLSPELRDRIARPMTLGDYQKIAPKWRAMLEARQAEDLAAIRAEDAAKQADIAKPLQRAMQRAIDRLGKAKSSGGNRRMEDSTSNQATR
jgi:hypothetical protein